MPTQQSSVGCAGCVVTLVALAVTAAIVGAAFSFGMSFFQ